MEEETGKPAIAGYRTLTDAEVGLINDIKRTGGLIEELVVRVREHVKAQGTAAHIAPDRAESDRIKSAEPGRWAAIGSTHLQEGLMALTRAVAQPTNY